MKSFNNHSGLRGLPCFAEGIYWATGLSLTTPFTEGCPGVNNVASPPGRQSRHQEQAPKQRCTFSSTTFSSVREARFCALSLKVGNQRPLSNIRLRRDFSTKLIYAVCLRVCRPHPLFSERLVEIVADPFDGKRVYTAFTPRATFSTVYFSIFVRGRQAPEVPYIWAKTLYCYPVTTPTPGNRPLPLKQRCWMHQ